MLIKNDMRNKIKMAQNRAARLLLIPVVAFMFAYTAQAVGLPGVYTYKLILRDDLGFALSGTETSAGDERVSSNYKIEVYTSDGVKLNVQVKDAVLDGRGTVGHNCAVTVPVGEGSGCAKVGEQLTLVVTTKYYGLERFRSSKVLPPVGGTMGFAHAPVGAFWSDPADTDDGWNVWLRTVEMYAPSSIGGLDDDYDEDGLSNVREYQLGTDPAGNVLGLPNTPEFSIEEQGGAYKVSFNYGWGHVYSIRTVEGTAAVGKDGQDLELYESLESLSAGTAFGKYFDDSDYNTGKKEFFVKKPALDGVFLIGLAVDGRLQEYIQVGEDASSVLVTPGFPIEYETEAAVTTVVETRLAGLPDEDADPALDSSNAVSSKPLGSGQVNTVYQVGYKDGSTYIFKPEAPGRQGLEGLQLSKGSYKDTQLVAQLNMSAQRTADAVRTTQSSPRMCRPM